MSIDFYKEFGDLGYLANYSNHGFTVDGVYYKTAEHFYQASKFDDPVIIQRILDCDTPKEASQIGRDRSFKRIPDFRNVKLEKMYQGVYEKFRQNPDILEKLLSTGKEEIREMTTKESYWGVGSNLDGENHMGKILMQVRDSFQQEYQK
ncbi:MAG: NADAR family protein [Bacilli bacterium]|nr:NADAR family protein [Bacilli bacterium]